MAERNELGRTLIAASAAASPAHILEALPAGVEHRALPGAPHTIYAELWHVDFWQRLSLDWIAGIPTPNPSTAAAGFPSQADIASTPWDVLCGSFLAGARQAADLTHDPATLDRLILCPSPPGHPDRTMTVQDQLVSLSAHNAYHLGRIVLLRQLLGAWPPPSGGFTW